MHLVLPLYVCQFSLSKLLLDHVIIELRLLLVVSSVFYVAFDEQDLCSGLIRYVVLTRVYASEVEPPSDGFLDVILADLVDADVVFELLGLRVDQHKCILSLH